MTLLERLRDRQDEDLNTVYAAIADAYMTSKMRQGAGEAMNRLSRRLREVNREKAKLVERLEQERDENDKLRGEVRMLRGEPALAAQHRVVETESFEYKVGDQIYSWGVVRNGERILYPWLSK